MNSVVVDVKQEPHATMLNRKRARYKDKVEVLRCTRMGVTDCQGPKVAEHPGL